MSCSSLEFKTKSGTGYQIQDKKSADDKFAIDFVLEKPFYFWGLMPRENQIILEDEAQKNGYLTFYPSEVIETNKTKKYLWSIMTLGFYYPRSFEIYGFEQN